MGISQRSFIAKNVRKRLPLKTVGTEKISISVFGDSKESRSKYLDIVEPKIKHHFENSYSVVEALVYPVICSDIKGSTTFGCERAIRSYFQSNFHRF